MWIGGHVAYGACIIVANIVIQFRYNNLTGWGEWTVVGMIITYFTILFLESMLPMFPQTYFIFDTMMSQGLVWSQIIVCALIASIVEYIQQLFKAQNRETNQGETTKTNLQKPELEMKNHNA